jgi:membrane fusion protein (multidrug efflux system)
VQDFQRVKADDLLVEIVDDDYRAQLDQAEANFAAAETAIENIEQQKVLQEALVKQAEATIRGTEVDLTRYHLERLRQQDLVAKEAGTPQLFEQATDNENRPQATLDLNKAQLEPMASLGPCRQAACMSMSSRRTWKDDRRAPLPN